MFNQRQDQKRIPIAPKTLVVAYYPKLGFFSWLVHRASGFLYGWKVRVAIPSFLFTPISYYKASWSIPTDIVVLSSCLAINSTNIQNTFGSRKLFIKK